MKQGQRGPRVGGRGDDAEALIEAMTCVRDVRAQRDRIDGLFEPLRGDDPAAQEVRRVHARGDARDARDGAVQVGGHQEGRRSTRARCSARCSRCSRRRSEKADEFRRKVQSSSRSSSTRRRPSSSRSASATRPTRSDRRVEPRSTTSRRGRKELRAAGALRRDRHQLARPEAVPQELDACSRRLGPRRSSSRTSSTRGARRCGPDVDVDDMMIYDVTKKLRRRSRRCRAPARQWDVLRRPHEDDRDMLVDAAARAGPARRGDARAPLEEADAHLRQDFRHGRQAQLGVLLGLELHKYADAVAEIVEQARAWRSRSTSSSRKIETTWMALQLEYEPFKTTGVQILKAADGDDRGARRPRGRAADMMGNRFMGFFETQITTWKGKLGGVRAVLENVDRGAAPVVLARGDLHRLGGHPRAAARGREALRRHRRRPSRSRWPTRRRRLNPLDACLKDGRDEEFTAASPRSSCAAARSPTTSRRSARSSRGSTSSRPPTSSTSSPRAHPPAVQEHFSKFTDNIGAIIWDKDDETGQEIGVAQGHGLGRQGGGPFYDAAASARPRRGLAARADGALLCNMKREQLEESSRASSRLPREKWLERSGARSSASPPPDLVDDSRSTRPSSASSRATRTR